jgi:quercetin dioxygenase-like cupin family protein
MESGIQIVKSGIQVIKRESIPRIQSVEQQGEVHAVGELRDFRWSEELREFMPEQSSFSASWVRLDLGETLQTHTHPVQSMMIVYSGCGEMRGDLCRQVSEGDVIVVPAGQKHGFVGGPGGLHCLSIQFGGGLYSSPQKARVIFADSEKSLNAVLAYHDARMARFSGHEVFALLEDGTLQVPAKRDAFLGAIQYLLEAGKRLLVACLASCGDSEYRAACTAWLGESSQAGSLERPDAARGELARPADAILDAISDWFAHQMYVLDNAEKAAIVCLVFGSAENLLRRYAARVVEKYGEADFQDGVDEARRVTAGEDLLRNETSETYAALRQIIGEAWDMIDAAGTRIVELTDSAS